MIFFVAMHCLQHSSGEPYGAHEDLSVLSDGIVVLARKKQSG